MNSALHPDSFLRDLDTVSKVRAKISQSLFSLADSLEKGELEGKTTSGKLELNQNITDIQTIAKTLQEGVFRLLVLGDMKRGKSTLLNALIGEKILPSDVNPCTALLTILRYGKEKKVTIYFNDGTPPEEISFTAFKENYTIDPAEAKILEKEKRSAFPTVSHAVVYYPLPLLEKGIEIVDSPGLNDTEARNELSLGYINNCHVILFVLRATQPCTLAERRYLENYLKDRGLTIFFLINAWDQIKESLIDPDDPEELREAEEKLRRVFWTNLSEYCQVDNYDLYSERVFELSALLALRRRLKGNAESLEGTGFSLFLAALNTFLTQERAVSELRQARILSRQTYRTIQESVNRRTLLLDEDTQVLKQRISSVEPEFKSLQSIRDQFIRDIREMRDQKAKSIAHYFRDYVLNLQDTFEADFLRYQPELNFLDFLSGNKRELFEKELQKAFEKYVNDKLSEWTLSAEKEMDAAFYSLSQSAISYGTSYRKVTDTISEKLTGQSIPPLLNSNAEDDAPAWAKWAAGIFSLARGNLAGVALAGAGFDWKNIVLNFITVMGVGGLITALTGVALGPIGIALLGLGIGVLQADQARKQFVKIAKQEFVKHLPQVAQQQQQTIEQAIQECFNIYEKEVTDRLNEDINARQKELDNLIQQKTSIEINQQAETQRLKNLEETVKNLTEDIENTYQDFLQTVG